MISDVLFLVKSNKTPEKCVFLNSEEIHLVLDICSEKYYNICMQAAYSVVLHPFLTRKTKNTG